MTTIAYKAGILASDSAWNGDHGLSTKRPKILRLSSGALLGEAGAADTRDMVELLDKVRTPKGLPSRKQLLELKLDYSAILVLPKGAIIHIFCDKPDEPQGDWDVGCYTIGESFFAVGSGAAYAIGVLEAGETAKRAVEIACRRDPDSRTPIHTLHLLHK